MTDLECKDSESHNNASSDTNSNEDSVNIIGHTDDTKTDGLNNGEGSKQDEVDGDFPGQGIKINLSN